MYVCEEDETLMVAEALKEAMIMETKIMSNLAKDEMVNLVMKSHTSPKGKVKGNQSFNLKVSRIAGDEGLGVVNRSYGGESKQKQKVCPHYGWHNHKSGFCKYKKQNIWRLNIQKKKNRTVTMYQILILHKII